MLIQLVGGPRDGEVMEVKNAQKHVRVVTRVAGPDGKEFFATGWYHRTENWSLSRKEVRFLWDGVDLRRR